MDHSFLAFLLVSIAVIVTPGQDTALTIRNTLASGPNGGLATALGVAMGQAVWALATSIGVVAILVASEAAFAAIKLAGAAYLIFLGLHSLHAALFAGGARTDHADRAAVAPLSPRKALVQGVLSNIGNPKMAIFFASLLPQFAPQDAAPFAAFMALGLVFCAMTFFWLTGYTLLVVKAGNVLRRPNIRRTLEGITGAALLALGLRIALSER